MYLARFDQTVQQRWEQLLNMALYMHRACRTARVFQQIFSTLEETLPQRLIGSSRTILSDAYYCRDAWNERLEDPVLRNVDIDKYFVELSKKFGSKTKASAVDVDIYLNKITNKDYAVEFENVLNRLRRSRNSADTLPSTPAAAVRFFLESEQHDVLMKILQNRLDYGVFPDCYSSNLLMDTFLEKGNHRDAAKVAIEMMLQEDTGNAVSQILGVYACHMYLREPKPEPWEPNPPAVEEEDDDDDEEIYVRVPNITNPFFDDHFDLNEPNHLIGKTLALFCGRGGDLLHRSYYLVGLGLYQKWQKAAEFLEAASAKGGGEEFVTRGAVDMFLAELTREGGLAEDDDTRKRLETALKTLESRFSTADLHELASKTLEKIPELEAADIEAQKRNFVSWREQRQRALEEQTTLFLRQQTIEEIRARKKELGEKEELLYAFENWDQIEMKMAEVQADMDELAAKENVQEEYIPPEVDKRFVSK
ncbi:28S ribosomal protein S27, mitochondrial [Ixodes scapularis]